MDYDIVNHKKYLLLYHIVLVTKYRHKILDILDIKSILKEVEKTSGFTIVELENESDHLHLLIKANPKDSISDIIRIIKLKSTFYCWNKYSEILRKYYWRKNILWSSSYFVCTIGNASLETIKRYIQEQ